MGALGSNYVSREELISYLGMADKPGNRRFETELDEAIESASREIERFCGRQFNRAETLSTRIYDVVDCEEVTVDDFWTATGLVIESGQGYGQTWTPTDYQLRPLNGIVEGQVGWPFWKIAGAVGGSRRFDRYGIRVTAKWGWAEVPAPIKQACFIIAAENFQLKGAKLGIAGFDEFAGYALRVRENKLAQSKMMKYQRTPVLVG